jgi:uncharacterized protein (TIGR00255 family)
MIKSMTGYGKGQADLPGKSITIELRSLNSKQLDLNLRAPQIFREKEMEIRTFLGQTLERGKIDASLNIESKTENPMVSFNRPLALQYYNQLRSLSESIPEAKLDDILSILVRLPDVFKIEKEEISEEEWEQIHLCLVKAAQDLNEFRCVEGQELEKDFIYRINLINTLLSQVEPFENGRVESFRNRLKTHLEELAPDLNYDANRLEQELIYYIEKLDITEEKIRLKKHIGYFLSTLKDSESPGKKLGFIVQEIGREINTLGSKANDADIQKIVVQMKDELEKVKEQLANIL